MQINRCGSLRATVTGPSLSVCRKQAQQVYSFVYKLSNSTPYDWLSFLTHSTVVPYLKFWGFTYSNLSTLVIKGYYWYWLSYTWFWDTSQWSIRVYLGNIDWLIDWLSQNANNKWCINRSIKYFIKDKWHFWHNASILKWTFCKQNCNTVKQEHSSCAQSPGG